MRSERRSSDSRLDFYIAFNFFRSLPYFTASRQGAPGNGRVHPSKGRAASFSILRAWSGVWRPADERGASRTHVCLSVLALA